MTNQNLKNKVINVIDAHERALFSGHAITRRDIKELRHKIEAIFEEEEVDVIVTIDQADTIEAIYAANARREYLS